MARIIRWPRWLRRGVITENAQVRCFNWGLNCISTLVDDSGWTPVFRAPGPRSTLHDPALTEAVEGINRIISGLQARSKRGQVPSFMVLEEGLCLTWLNDLPELSERTDDEVNEYLRRRKLSDVDLLTASERRRLFDLPNGARQSEPATAPAATAKPRPKARPAAAPA